MANSRVGSTVSAPNSLARLRRTSMRRRSEPITQTAPPPFIADKWNKFRRADVILGIGATKDATAALGLMRGCQSGRDVLLGTDRPRPLQGRQGGPWRRVVWCQRGWGRGRSRAERSGLDKRRATFGRKIQLRSLHLETRGSSRCCRHIVLGASLARGPLRVISRPDRLARGRVCPKAERRSFLAP